MLDDVGSDAAMIGRVMDHGLKCWNGSCMLSSLYGQLSHGIHSPGCVAQVECPAGPRVTSIPTGQWRAGTAASACGQSRFMMFCCFHSIFCFFDHPINPMIFFFFQVTGCHWCSVLHSLACLFAKPSLEIHSRSTPSPDW